MIMVTQEKLKEMYSYHPETGLFKYGKQRQWCKSGSLAGGRNSAGYIDLNILGKKYRAHRMAWLYVYGEIPDNEIDHINGDRTDNRISNLRQASRSENCRNMGKQPFNTTGYKGVTIEKKINKYKAQIVHKARNYFLGYFDTAIEAHLAYCDAARVIHGDFFRGE